MWTKHINFEDDNDDGIIGKSLCHPSCTHSQFY